MSRRSAILLAACPTLVLPCGLAAQEPLEAQSATPPERIDILVDTSTPREEYEDCEEDQDAATITGEIIVCRKRSGDENRLYDEETAKRRHAERTMNHNEIAAPDVAGAGIFRGPATISGLCFIPPCPEPPAYLIDFDELPETPPGSDADRAAQGLAPRGYHAGPDGAVTVAGEAGQQRNADVLGLPPPLDESDKEGEEEISPSGSASPAEEPSG